MGGIPDYPPYPYGWYRRASEEPFSGCIPEHKQRECGAGLVPKEPMSIRASKSGEPDKLDGGAATGFVADEPST